MARGGPGGGPGPGWAVVAVLPQWLVARAVVLGALALAHLVVDRTHPATPGVSARVHQGLLGWDAGWYQAIARLGYRPLGHQSLRFFPLFPLLGRALAVLPGISDGPALLVVANLSALVASALLLVLVRRETGDAALADRSVWLLSLAPPAFVLVMGYAESLLLVFFVGSFLALRRPSGAAPCWWAVAVLGLGAGLTRPLGLLLAVPVAVEAARRWRRAKGPERAVSLLAVAAPLAGTAAFLGWSWGVFGDALLPLAGPGPGGPPRRAVGPLRTVVDDARGVLHHHFGTALHVPWVVLVVALVVVCWRRLPAPRGPGHRGGLGGPRRDQPRLLRALRPQRLPLVVAGATLTASRRVEVCVLTLAAAGLGAYAVLAFLNISVP